MLRAVVLTQYRRATDGWTDRIAVANTALAMQAFALWRAVKHDNIQTDSHHAKQCSTHNQVEFPTYDTICGIFTPFPCMQKSVLNMRKLWTNVSRLLFLLTILSHTLDV